MKTIWDSEARQAMRQIAKYIQKRFGSKVRMSFVDEVRKTDKLLQINPQIGKIDPLFADRKRVYRSVIINGLSKMVYFIDSETIYIAAFWDTRREPKEQAKQVNGKIES